MSAGRQQRKNHCERQFKENKLSDKMPNVIDVSGRNVNKGNAGIIITQSRRLDEMEIDNT